MYLKIVLTKLALQILKNRYIFKRCLSACELDIKNRQVSEKERSWLDCSFILLAHSYHSTLAGQSSYNGSGAGVAIVNVFHEFPIQTIYDSSLRFSLNTWERCFRFGKAEIFKKAL